MPSGTILQLLVGIIALALLWTTWWFKRQDAIKKERSDAKKAISDAIASGDISRIHAIIDGLRK